MARRSLLAGLLVGLILVAPAAAQSHGLPQCADDDLPDYGLPNGYPFDVHRIVALFRFHRQAEALRELDAARAPVRGPWRWRLPPDAREEVASRLDALRDCLAEAKPPRLAKLTVRVLGYGTEANVGMLPR